MASLDQARFDDVPSLFQEASGYPRPIATNHLRLKFMAFVPVPFYVSQVLGEAMTVHSREDRLQAVLQAYLQALERGEKPDLAQLLEANPDFRDELAAYFSDATKRERVALSGRTATFGGKLDGVAGKAAPSPRELAKQFPQFEIIELLGQGGMGAVYKARQKGLDRLVAIKILPPSPDRASTFVERFMREAKALAKLNHPNIVAVYDVGQTVNGLCYFVMEYIDGPNLRQAMLGGKMTPNDALAVVPQICEALQFAHDEGVVHRDIKPANLLLDKKGRIKIADFGLAKLLTNPGDASVESLTGTDQVMGTLRYMAPEQMGGSKQIDHRADIYSLGVVFYEMLTGEVPVGRFSPPSKKVQIDVRLDEVVLRALEQEPELRWQHASDVKTEVESIVHTNSGRAANGPVVSGQSEPREPAKGWLLERWRSAPSTVRLAGRAALFLVYLICLIFFFSFGTSDRTDATGRSHRFSIGIPGPWFVHVTNPMGYSIGVQLFASSNLAAIGGFAALWISRMLKRLEGRKVLSMGWHYGLWLFLLFTAAAICILSFTLSQRVRNQS